MGPVQLHVTVPIVVPKTAALQNSLRENKHDTPSEEPPTICDGQSSLD